MSTRIALVMAGGGGTRLWPASTPERPKQLIDDLPERGTTLIGATAARVSEIVEHTFVITTMEQAPAIRAALPHLPAEHVIAEPYGRNTAPCIALSLARIRSILGDEADDSVVIALPSDHFVADEPAFRKHIEQACDHAKNRQAIALLGIKPTGPETGYGYIRCSPQGLKDSELPTFAVDAFVEKPDNATAQAYLAEGNYLWNAGIFALPFRRGETEFETHCPDTWRALAALRSSGLSSGEVQRIATEAYANIAPQPFDVAIMEQQRDASVVPFDGGWSDLGSWNSIKDMLAPEAGSNAVSCSEGAHAVLHDSRNCLVWSEGASIGVLGLENVAVIESGGKILVCPLDRAQEVRAIVDGFNKDD